jgi:diguanylate cyclase (GGDEF)-like protein
VLAVYIAACALVHRAFVGHDSVTHSELASEESSIDAELKVLEEAGEYFAGALTSGDTFRLVASRVAQIVPHEGMCLLLLDRKREQWVATQTTDSTIEKGLRVTGDDDRIRECLTERDVAVNAGTLTAALPLRHETEIFGILLLHFSNGQEAAAAVASVLDAVASRAAPLFLASIALDRSRENALNDTATDLPNERAFHLVLENQVAEAIRRSESRPLAILSLGVRDLDEIGSRYGHAAADRVLTFVAQNLKDNLRQMDFLARGGGDEFLTVLPTASQEIIHQIIARIQTSLVGTKIKVSDVDAIEIELHIGWASFGQDGDTPNALMRAARERREQSNSSMHGSVLWFPQETAH